MGALDLVVNALETLQSRGEKVWVISHVVAMLAPSAVPIQHGLRWGARQ